jgi:hypothetical protein
LIGEATAAMEMMPPRTKLAARAGCAKSTDQLPNARAASQAERKTPPRATAATRTRWEIWADIGPPDEPPNRTLRSYCLLGHGCEKVRPPNWIQIQLILDGRRGDHVGRI